MITISQALATAVWHHQAGRFAQAEQIYQQVLAVEPDNASALHLLGVIAAQSGRPEIAASSIRRAIGIDGQVPEFHNNLGNVLKVQGDIQGALDCYQRALVLQPGYVDALLNLGLALHALGDDSGAEKAFRQALERNSECVDAWINLGSLLLSQHHFSDAAPCFRRALELQPENVAVHNQLGLALLRAGQWEAAAVELRRLLGLAPDHFAALSNLALALRHLGDLDGAEASWRRAIELSPNCAEAHHELGLVMTQRGDLEAALACFRRTLQIDPRHVGAHNNAANILNLQGDRPGALASYRCALELQPDFAEAHVNLGMLLHDMGDLEAAEDCYCRALALKPDYADVRFHRAIISLLKGNFSAGWPDYEWRWKMESFKRRNFSYPQWRGEPIAGKTILLVAEQGLGDTIQFVRYVRLVKELGARTVVECPTILRPLLQRCREIDQLLEGGPPPEIDQYCPLLSLPGIFQTTLSTIPADVPYLSTDPALIERWRQELSHVPGCRIGIAWQGSKEHRIDKYRSIPLRQFAPIAASPGVTLFSLQKGNGTEQLRNAPFPIREIEKLDESSGAFLETAALMQNLDLVVCIDSAVAHLAGALGVPVWVALPDAPDWRWMLDRDDTPWYPSMRLFRQARGESWDAVIERMASALRDRAPLS